MSLDVLDQLIVRLAFDIHTTGTMNNLHRSSFVGWPETAPAQHACGGRTPDFFMLPGSTNPHRQFLNAKRCWA